MLEQVLEYLHNWFVKDIFRGTFTIENGGITLSSLLTGQYFRIIGSIFNDGLYKYGDDLGLTDETFTGAIWGLAVPPAVLAIVKDIEDWQTKYGDTATSPYSSESFGGYSYTKASSGNSNNSGADASDWRTIFKARLTPYRKAREMAPVDPTGYQDPGYQRPFNPDFPWWK